MKKGNYFHLKKQKGANEMTNSKSKNFGKKLAAILLAATAIIVPAISFGFANVSLAETEDLRVGDIISEKKEAWVVKETICVKRWQEYSFKLTYEGVKRNVFVCEVHPFCLMKGGSEIVFESEKQTVDSYSLTETVTSTVSIDLKAISSAKFTDFFGNLTGNIKKEEGISYEKQISTARTISHTTKIVERERVTYKPNGSEASPYEKYYVDALMMLKAHKFKLEVYEKQCAKNRSSGLAKWGDYVDEKKGTYTYYIYSSYYDTPSNYYRNIGCIGTEEDYEKLITNYGK